MFNNLRQDYLRFGKGQPNLLKYMCRAIFSAGFRAIMLYRIGYWFREHHLIILAVLVERVMHHVSHCWISTKARIGPGFVVAHVSGLVIGGATQIGSNCDVRQNVTFGGNYSKKHPSGRQQPVVGDNVSVGAGAVIIGPITIGSNSIIGANSVVNRDVPENVIVFGVPAKVIKEKWDESTGRKL